MPPAWRLRPLPRISSERQAPKTATLRKKSQLAPKALWRSFTGGKMIFGKMDKNRKTYGELLYAAVAGAAVWLTGSILPSRNIYAAIPIDR